MRTRSSHQRKVSIPRRDRTRATLIAVLAIGLSGVASLLSFWLSGDTVAPLAFWLKALSALAATGAGAAIWMLRERSWKE
jgi:hypothetical protein